MAYVLSGEVTFKIGDEVTPGGPGTCAFMPRGVQYAWKNSSAEAGRVLFLYTPAAAGGLAEEQQRTHERAGAELLQRYGWEIVGSNPLQPARGCESMLANRAVYRTGARAAPLRPVTASVPRTGSESNAGAAI